MKGEIYNEDCLVGMKRLSEGSIDLLVTSPPYYNAREYSQWDTLEDYLNNMREIFEEVYRVIKNYHCIVVNVSDIIGSTNGKGSSKRKIPLGAYFLVMLEEIGFRYMDDVLWDKGEVHSKRHIVGKNYPYQKHPINVYEHLLVFRKIEDPKEKPRCPVCNGNKVGINGRTGGIITYECNNPECSHKSPSGRGKRFSEVNLMVSDYESNKENEIEEELLKKWRKDLVYIPAVKKINSKGDNIYKHTAPFPEDIPYYFIKMYSGVGDTVLDIFMGSGTTAKVSKDLGRNYIGYEINSDYYNLIKERGL